MCISYVFRNHAESTVTWLHFFIYPHYFWKFSEIVRYQCYYFSFNVPFFLKTFFMIMYINLIFVCIIYVTEDKLSIAFLHSFQIILDNSFKWSSFMISVSIRISSDQKNVIWNHFYTPNLIAVSVRFIFWFWNSRKLTL